MSQRYDVETNIAPPMRQAITLVHKSGLLIYVAQSIFGRNDQTQTELTRVARLVAAALEEN